MIEMSAMAVIIYVLLVIIVYTAYEAGFSEGRDKTLEMVSQAREIALKECPHAQDCMIIFEEHLERLVCLGFTNIETPLDNRF